MSGIDSRFWQDLQQLAQEYLLQESGREPFPVGPPGQAAGDPAFALGPNGVGHAAWMERIRSILQQTPSSSHPYFVNQLFGGRIPEAVLAEMLAVLANSSLYTYKAAGAQVLVENEVLHRMLQAAGLPQGEGSFMPGGSAANLTAMLLARNRALPAYRDEGPRPAVPATVYTSAESHYSIRKNAGILGIGRNQVRMIPVRADGSMDLDALDEQIRRDQAAGCVPLLINATAGTTVRGAFDDIRGAARVAQACGLWLHVDGALGATLLLSDRWRFRLDGIEQADSLTWNPHKMMGVGLQASVLLVRTRGSLQGSLDETADYLFQEHTDDCNPGHRSLQCGRRNDAFRLWAAWCRLGDAGWAERIDRQMQLAQDAARLIEADPVLELLEPPQSVNVCFRHRAAEPEAVCKELNETGAVKIGYGNVGGQTAIRLVCVNPEIGRTGMEQILARVRSAGQRLADPETPEQDG